MKYLNMGLSLNMTRQGVYVYYLIESLNIYDQAGCLFYLKTRFSLNMTKQRTGCMYYLKTQMNHDQT